MFLLSKFCTNWGQRFESQTFPAIFGPPLKFSPACWLPFVENRCWRCGGVRKSRSPVFRGHSPGLGGEAKSFSNNKQACCLKLRFAKLEAPLRGAMPGLTTARPVGRRISCNASKIHSVSRHFSQNGRIGGGRGSCLGPPSAPRARGLPACDVPAGGAGPDSTEPRGGP